MSSEKQYAKHRSPFEAFNWAKQAWRRQWIIRELIRNLYESLTGVVQLDDATGNKRIAVERFG